MLERTPILLVAALLAVAACSTDAPTLPSRTDTAKQAEAAPGKPEALEVKQTMQHPVPLEERDGRRQRSEAEYTARENAPASPAAVAAGSLELAAIRAPSELLDRESYAHFDDTPLKRVAEHKLADAESPPSQPSCGPRNVTRRRFD